MAASGNASISVLNDDCLEAIFKQINDTADYYSLSMTSTRFLAIGKMAFSYTYTTYERIDEKILRVFGDKLVNINVKLRTFENPPQFFDQNLCKTHMLIQKYCINLINCKVMLSKCYSDFNNIPHDNAFNWYNIGNNGGFNHLNDDNLFIDIKSKQNLSKFITNFTNYLRRNGDNIYDDNYNIIANQQDDHNISDLANKAMLIYDSTSEDKIRFLGNNLTHVKIELNDYYFDLKKLSSELLDQHEIIRQLQQHCPNIINLKIQIFDANLFRKKSFHNLLGKLSKLKLTILIEHINNFANVKNYIVNAMNACVKLKTLTLNKSSSKTSSKYLEPFIMARYPNLNKISIISTELFDNNLIEQFKNNNTNVQEMIIHYSKIENRN